MIIGEYIKKKILGQGAFGTVFIGTNKNTGEDFAIKEMSKNYLYQNPKNYNDFMRELRIIQTIKSENSVRYINYFEDNINCYIVMELCDSDLLKYLQEVHINRFSTEEIREIISQLNNTFREMRNLKLIHRDLKLGNILMKFLNKEKTKFIVKVSDFGLSRNINNNANYEYMSTIGIGDPIIKAPELCYNQPYNEKCDLWSIGIIIYHLYFHCLPDICLNVSPMEYFNAIIYNVQNSKHMDPQLRDLLNKLLVINQEERISWDEYFNHPFFKEDDEIPARYNKISDFDLGFNFNNNKDIYECFIAKDYKENKTVLIKSYKKSFVDNNYDINILFNNEIYLFKQFKGNPNVLNLIDEYIEDGRVFYVFEYNDFEMLSIYSNKREMKEKEIKRINKILFENVLIFNENINLSFNFISIHSFCMDKKGNPLLFDFGFHKVFLPNQELALYFFPNPLELKLYYINNIRTNVMNYGVTLLLLLCKNDFKYKDKAIILPKNVSDKFKKFLSKCLIRKFNKRYYWYHLGKEEFLLDSNNEMSNIVDNNILLDNDKLEIIFNSLRNRFDGIINYYEKFNIQKNLKYIEQIESFIFITLFEMKIILKFFDKIIYNKPLTNENEISFISINDRGYIKKLNLNFANPIFGDTRIINMNDNILIINFIEEIKVYTKRMQKVLKKIISHSKKSIINNNNNYENFVNDIIQKFDNSKMQEYFFKVIINGEKENNKSDALNEISIAEHLCELIIFINSVLYENEENNYFYKMDFMEYFNDFFGNDKNKIEISFVFDKKTKNEYFLVSFIPILFRHYKRKNMNIKKYSLYENPNNGVIAKYPYLIRKFIDLKENH